MLKIRFKLFRNILIAIICLGVISIYTYAYLHKKEFFAVGEKENDKTIPQQFIFGKEFNNIKFNQRNPRNLFATLIYYRVLIWSGYYGVSDDAIDCISQEPIAGKKIDYSLYIQNFTKLTSAFIGLNFTLDDIPERVSGNTCVVRLGSQVRFQNFYLSKRIDGNWFFTEKNFKNPDAEELDIYKAFLNNSNTSGKDAQYSLPLPAYFRFIMGFLNQLNFDFDDAKNVMDLSWIAPIVKKKYSRFLAFLLVKVLETKNVNTTSVSWWDSPHQDIVLLCIADGSSRSIYMQKKIINKEGGNIWVFNKKVLNNARMVFMNERMTELFTDSLWFSCRHFFLTHAAFLRYTIFGYTAYFWINVLVGFILLILFYKFFKVIIGFLLGKLNFGKSIGNYKKLSKHFSVLSSLIISMYIYVILAEHNIMFYYETYLFFVYSITVVFGILIICWLCNVVLLISSVVAYILEQGSEERFRITFAIEIIQRLLCIVIIVVFSGILLQKMGLDTVRYLAALGIGGLAVALAGKDTIENLFGSIMIALEKPFKVGDWIIIGDIEGHVEYVGLRSTKILTFEDSYLTVPNVKFITSSINNMGRRHFRRYDTVLDFSDKTSQKLLLTFIEKIDKIIKTTPNMRKNNYYVRVNDIGESSVKVLIYVYFIASNWNEELIERQKFILSILSTVEELNMELAYPAQTLYLAKQKKQNKKEHEDLNLKKINSEFSKARNN
jgi:MscS family membrane protein